MVRNLNSSLSYLIITLVSEHFAFHIFCKISIFDEGHGSQTELALPGSAHLFGNELIKCIFSKTVIPRHRCMKNKNAPL
jgi:hypothetical protein